MCYAFGTCPLRMLLRNNSLERRVFETVMSSGQLNHLISMPVIFCTTTLKICSHCAIGGQIRTFERFPASVVLVITFFILSVGVLIMRVK